MRVDEFDSFKGELKQLCASLGKGYTDALGQAYWRVLKDVPLAEIEANVERILLSASKDTKFPRPLELRTTPTVLSGQLPGGATKLNQEVWKAKFERNGSLAEVDFRYCQYQRILASTHESAVEHDMALRASRAIIKAHGDPRFFYYS